MPRIMVRLDDVVCFDPEDLSGGDEFYVLGAVSDGEQTEGVATVPIQVSAGQTKAFGVGGGVVFDKMVTQDRVLKIYLTAFDEDSAKDWGKQSEIVDKIAGAVAGGLAAIPNPYTAGAAILLPFVVKIAGGIISLDKDDNLGEYEQSLPVWALPVGSNQREWQFNGEWAGGFLGFSRWSYALRYTVVVE